MGSSSPKVGMGKVTGSATPQAIFFQHSGKWQKMVKNDERRHVFPIPDSSVVSFRCRGIQNLLVDAI